MVGSTLFSVFVCVVNLAAIAVFYSFNYFFDKYVEVAYFR